LFETLREWFERRRTLREAEVADRQDRGAYGHFFSEQIEFAFEALGQGAHEQAYGIWAKMRGRFPDLSLTSKRGLSLLLDLRRYDEAEAMMQEGRERHPFLADFYTAGSAQVAYRRGDANEAIHRCQILRRKFPRVADGYAIAAACLAELGRHDEAEAMIGRGLQMAPTEFELHKQYARNAMRNQDWPEALRRWKIVCEQFGENWLGPLSVAQCLRELGRFAEAEKSLSQACERFQRTDWLFAEVADLATAKGEFDEAVRCWELVLTRFPGLNIAYTRGAAAMRKIGREVAADKLLGVAVQRFKSDIHVHIEHAKSAHDRGDWKAATERWILVRDRFPECVEAPARVAEALKAARQQIGRCGELTNNGSAFLEAETVVMQHNVGGGGTNDRSLETELSWPS
jgi:tetratricopeptide (TPR) repeat protein